MDLIDMLDAVPPGTLFRADELLELLDDQRPKKTLEIVRDLTVQDIAEVEGRSKETVRNWFRTGRFLGYNSYKLDGEWRLPRAGYEAWQERQRGNSPALDDEIPDIGAWRRTR